MVADGFRIAAQIVDAGQNVHVAEHARGDERCEARWRGRRVERADHLRDPLVVKDAVRNEPVHQPYRRRWLGSAQPARSHRLQERQRQGNAGAAQERAA